MTAPRRIVLALMLASVLALPSASHATFPGKNGTIGFVAQQDECLLPEADDCNSGQPQIFTIRPDGSRRTRLTAGFGPAYSRDGRSLAFDRCYCTDADFLSPSATVYTWRLGAMTPPSRLLERGDGTANLHAAWSPDGGRLVFARVRNPTDRLTASSSTIYSIPSGGGDAHRLASGYAPDWSSANRIAFVRYGRSGLDIYVMRPDGSGVRRVGRGAAPSWSPGARWIAFEGAGRERDGIYVARPDGSGLRRVTTGNDFEPAWSPDGRLIAFVRASSRGTVFRLMTVTRDGHRPRVIARSPEARLLDSPSWQPLPRKRGGH